MRPAAHPDRAVGVGGDVHAALSSLATTFTEGSDRNTALGVWGAVSGIAGAVGVFLGGVLSQGPGWRWVLFVNPPICVPILAAALSGRAAKVRYLGLRSGVVFRTGAGELAARSGLRLAAEEEGGSMVSAYLITREPVGYAAAAFRSEQDPVGAGVVGSLCSAARSRAGWTRSRGWRYR